MKLQTLSLLISLSGLASASPAPQQQQRILSSDSVAEDIVAFSGEGKPLVSTEALQDAIKGDLLLNRAKKLFSLAQHSEHDYGHPTRVIGSPGHWATLDYVRNTLSKLDGYYTLSNQSFPATIGEIYEARLVLDDSVPKSARAMALSPPTKDKQPVFADLSLSSNDGCDPSDFGPSVKGSIVFIQRGVCPFGVKSENAGRAGAVAAVVYNNVEGPMGGTLGEPNKWHVPTFSVSLEDALPNLERLRAGDYLNGIAYVNSLVEKIETTNIIAQTVAGDPENCVMLGGHSDSVGEGPGINDDGTGSLTLLEIAVQLSKFDVKNCVRFAWWAGEEEGLLGSDWYVAQLTPEENKKIRLFMDYDMLASPNFAYQVYNAKDSVNPVGSQALRDLYTDWYESKGLNWTYIPFDGRSDYDAFIKHGIPGGGIATGAEGIKTKEEVAMFGGTAGEWYDHCYHQLCDDVSNVNMEAWEVNAKLVAHSVATYALSFKGFPERTQIGRVETEDAKLELYHGPQLVA